MKRLALLVIAMMGLFFTSCKPEPEGNDNGGNNGGEANKVKISCTIPINKDTRSDFTGLFEDGVINWSDGRECVYLAIPGDEPMVVELEGYCDGYKPKIEFIAYVDENLLTAGESYDIWYFGHSQQLDEPYVSLVNGNKIEGSIAKQTGRLEDLGYSHIASTSVKAVMENGEVKLPLVGTLKNRMAIALLNLNTVTELYGNAVNTDYTLEYNAEVGRFEFNVIEDNDASIEVESAMGISYIVFLPNGNNKVELECKIREHTSKYVFYNGIKENKIYYRYTANENMTYLDWIGENSVNGYEYVDLGLPSGLKWATCDIDVRSSGTGANTFAWGEVSNLFLSSASGLNLSELQLQGYIDDECNLTAQHDAAVVNCGGNWRMPTKDDVKELLGNVSVSSTKLNGVTVPVLTSKINGNKIYFSEGTWWSSTPYDDNEAYSLVLRYDNAYKQYYAQLGTTLRNPDYKHAVRPVLE